jgi:four helix bundle protein
MAKISHFRELRVWQGGMDLVEAVYRASAMFPGAEIYGLTGQIRRAAVSIPSNIAEGQTRESKKEYFNHLSIAQASLAEVGTQIEIAKRPGYVSDQQVLPRFELATRLGRQLYALRDALHKRQ